MGRKRSIGVRKTRLTKGENVDGIAKREHAEKGEAGEWLLGEH